MTQTVLLEGPFESDYSLAIVNRNLARAMSRMGIAVSLHQRDNTTHCFPSDEFLSAHQDLAPLFVRDIDDVETVVHSRYIYPPYTDTFRGKLRVVHCYGWEESVFPRQFVDCFNQGLDLITVMSTYVRDVLVRNGVTVPIVVAGLGADHILAEPAKPVEWMNGETFDFLHISSCFPRKGADVLVRAFCAEFTDGENVRLIIKTFPNPHNDIERIVAEISREYPRHAPIKTVFTPLALGEIRYLYEHAGCLVSTSRGEGFGLPAAEAMFLGCPVIATIYSGQADICRPDHCWPVDYRREKAQTHLSEGQSLWAEPLAESLRAQMRALYRATRQERLVRTERARCFVSGRFTWDRVAQRHWEFCQASMAASSAKSTRCITHSTGTPAKIGFISTWNTRCGIAEYTRYLATNLPPGNEVAVFAARSPDLVRPDEPFVSRCWEQHHDDKRIPGEIEEVVRSILRARVRAVSIQYNFGFFSPADLASLTRRLREERLVIIVTLHSANHPNFQHLKDALKQADFCVCHRQTDVEAVQQLGLTNAILRKHGIVTSDALHNHPDSAMARQRLSFLVSCFGFFLPPKGIDHLIHAFAWARQVQPFLRLKLLNSLYPFSQSTSYAQQCLHLIEDKHLRGEVEISTVFLDHEKILQELAKSDLVVLPYAHSTESASGAGAFAVASLKPVLCSDLPVFDELSGITHRYPAGNIFALSNKILQLASHPHELNRYRVAQKELAQQFAWPAVARDMVDLIATRMCAQKYT